MNPVRTSFNAFWEARNARERSVLLIAAGLVMLLLVWMWLIDPALQGRAQLKKTLPTMQAQLAQLQALTKQAAALPAIRDADKDSTGSAAAASSPLSRSMLESSLARKGLKPQTLDVNAEQVRLKLSGVSFAALIGWLADMQASAQLAVSEANVVALEQSDQVDASLSLRQQR